MIDLWLTTGQGWHLVGWGDEAEVSELESQLLGMDLTCRMRRCSRQTGPTWDGMPFMGTRGKAGVLGDPRADGDKYNTSVYLLRARMAQEEARQAGTPLELSLPDPPARTTHVKKARKASLLFPEPEKDMIPDIKLQFRPD